MSWGRTGRHYLGQYCLTLRKSPYLYKPHSIPLYKGNNNFYFLTFIGLCFLLSRASCTSYYSTSFAFINQFLPLTSLIFASPLATTMLFPLFPTWSIPKKYCLVAFTSFLQKTCSIFRLHYHIHGIQLGLWSLLG